MSDLLKGPWLRVGTTVYAEGEEETVLRAVQVVVDEGLGKPILIGRPEVIDKRIKRAGLRIQPLDHHACRCQHARAVLLDDARHRVATQAIATTGQCGGVRAFIVKPKGLRRTGRTRRRGIRSHENPFEYGSGKFCGALRTQDVAFNA